MRTVLSLVMTSMLVLSLPAVAKLPAAEVRRAIVQVMRAGDVNGLAAVLAQHGLTVNSIIGTGGYTLLHDAVVEGTPEIVDYLLNHDAAVNTPNQYGFTALDEAKAFDKPEMVALLEQAGAVHSDYLKGVSTAPNIPNIQPIAVHSHSVAVYRMAARYPLSSVFGDDLPPAFDDIGGNAVVEFGVTLKTGWVSMAAMEQQ